MGIILIIITPTLVYLVARLLSDLSEQDDAPSRSDSEISTVEQLREARAQYLLRENIKSFRSQIFRDICSLCNERIPELKDANAYAIKKLKELFDMNIVTESQLDYAEWLYNNGDLRTEGEVAYRKWKEDAYHYVESGGLQRDNTRRTYIMSIACFIIGFTVVFMPMAMSGKELGILVGAVFGIMLGLLLGLISSCVAHSINASMAEDYGPAGAAIARQEAIKRNANIAITIGSVAGVACHARKTVKDIANVDGWKEMK